MSVTSRCNKSWNQGLIWVTWELVVAPVGDRDMSRSLELPDSIYQALLDAAEASGVTPVDWIAQRLPRVNGSASSETERKAGLARLLQHTVSLGKPTGANNEQIDADLAREYANSPDGAPSGTTAES
jgi:hypothetical protein